MVTFTSKPKSIEKSFKLDCTEIIKVQNSPICFQYYEIFSEIAFSRDKTMLQRPPKCINSIIGTRVSISYLAQQEGKFAEVKYKYSKMS